MTSRADSSGISDSLATLRNGMLSVSGVRAAVVKPLAAIRRPLLPAAAQRPVKIHERQQLLQPQLSLRQLRLKQVALGAEHLQIAVGAALVAQRSQARGLRQ